MLDAVIETPEIEVIRPTSNRRPIWDRIGKPTPDGMSVAEAFTKASLNYEVVKGEVFTEIEGVRVPLEDRQTFVKKSILPDGSLRYSPFDVSSGRYEPLDNMTLANALEPFRQQYALHTVGDWKNGEQVYVVFKANEQVLRLGRQLDDIINWHIIISDFKRPGRALSVSVVALRLICVNGNWIEDAVFDTKLPHLKGMSELAGWYLNANRQIANSMLRQEQLFEALGSERFVGDSRQVWEAIYAYPKAPDHFKGRELEELAFATGQSVSEVAAATDSHAHVLSLLTQKQANAERRYQWSVERMDAFRIATQERYEGEVAAQGVAGTKYGLWQAVTAQMDHGSESQKATRAALFGDRALYKTRAVNIISDWN